MHLHQVGSLDLLIKSHWYKCSMLLDGHYLNITLDDDIDMISSQVSQLADFFCDQLSGHTGGQQAHFLNDHQLAGQPSQLADFLYMISSQVSQLADFEAILSIILCNIVESNPIFLA